MLENGYQSRPPQPVSMYNPKVGPQSYHSKVDYSKPSGQLACKDKFGMSATTRKILWEEELEARDYKDDMQLKTKKKEA